MRVHLAEEQRATHRIAGSRRWFLAVVLFFLFAAGVYDWATPFFEKPDESEHFYFALHLAREQRLPVQSAASKSTPWKQEASQPPLYHWLASLVLWPLRDEIPYDALAENPHAAIGQPLAPDNKNAFLHPPTTELPAAFVWGVHLARWLSVVMGVLTVWATWRMARLLLPTMPETALFIAAWLAALPQFLFISSAVSNDATVTALATLCLWMLLRAIRFQGLAWGETLLLGVLAGALALAKLNGLFFLVVAAPVLLLLEWRGKPAPHRVRPLVVLVAIGVGVLIIAGWWYWRNWTLYGDPTGVSAMLEIVGRYSKPRSFSFMLWAFSGLRFSFWGVFGWFNILAPRWWYTLLDVLTLAALVGLGVQAWRVWLRRHSIAWRTALMWGVVLVWPLLILAGVFNWARITPGAQGRLLFPALAPLMLLLGVGLRTITPARWRVRLAWLACSAWALSALWLPLGVIRPAYTPPPHGEQIALPDEMVRLNWRTGAMTLLGYTISPRVLEPGAMARVVLYWQADTPLHEAYSVSTKLYGYRDEFLGQHDSYPGGGTYPTTFWQVGEIVTDPHWIPVSETADTPVLAALWVNVYRYETREPLPWLTPEGRQPSLPAVGRVVIKRPAFGEHTAPLATFDDGIALLAHEVALDGAQAAVRLTWLAQQPPSAGYTVFVHLVPADTLTSPITQADAPPRDGFMPTWAWQAGDLVPDEHMLPLPNDVPPGVYAIIVGLYHPETGRRLAVTPRDAVFGDAIPVARLMFDGTTWRLDDDAQER
ncbi:hypothetical protein ARMA_2391 [Ardenticatena maritima]|uniref:Glycosyltransferase RgtA/B/C/D-like domain-containing protein n=2 Tax=Ardenticatena maritima TaxID=872965 RepID=A0A0M9UDF4_9CHLR|nr:glycosyltransferase family 39 protein [Ardenticatena maritima]KPL88465.1 hypothetical protein SE16_06625 [Ardenticatena maritima]GAP63968.1 hypothetical protein ARMA_2391 [Ardenticatena maritima]